MEITMIELPVNWHTAKECHECANSWETDEMRSCMDVIMDQIWDVAMRGGTCCTVAVKGCRPDHFYEVLESIMKALGYEVVVPGTPMYGANSNWTFKW